MNSGVEAELRAEIERLTAEREQFVEIGKANRRLLKNNSDLTDIANRRQVEIYNLQSRLGSNTAEAMVQSCEQYPPVYHPTRLEMHVMSYMPVVISIGEPQNLSLKDCVFIAVTHAKAVIAALDAETNGGENADLFEYLLSGRRETIEVSDDRPLLAPMAERGKRTVHVLDPDEQRIQDRFDDEARDYRNDAVIARCEASYRGGYDG